MEGEIEFVSERRKEKKREGEGRGWVRVGIFVVVVCGGGGSCCCYWWWGLTFFVLWEYKNCQFSFSFWQRECFFSWPFFSFLFVFLLPFGCGVDKSFVDNIVRHY